jgi:hypothetical protein
VPEANLFRLQVKKYLKNSCGTNRIPWHQPASELAKVAQKRFILKIPV